LAVRFPTLLFTLFFIQAQQPLNSMYDSMYLDIACTVNFYIEKQQLILAECLVAKRAHYPAIGGSIPHSAFALFFI
jgi:hypothetical protein